MINNREYKSFNKISTLSFEKKGVSFAWWKLFNHFERRFPNSEHSRRGQVALERVIVETFTNVPRFVSMSTIGLLCELREPHTSPYLFASRTSFASWNDEFERRCRIDSTCINRRPIRSPISSLRLHSKWDCKCWFNREWKRCLYTMQSSLYIYNNIFLLYVL